MTFIRSLIFDVYYILATIFICTLGCLIFFVPQRPVIARWWGKMIIWGMRVIVGLDFEVRGMANLPQDSHRYIVASKHQSAMETMAYHALLPLPVYILKKELLYIPLFAWNLLLMGSIPIDRSSGAKAMRTMLEGAQKRLSQNRPVVIFPEGTRTPPDQPTKCNPGVALLYEKCDVPIIPAAVNTGYFWGKKAFIKKPGKVVIEFLPAMPKGLAKREFLTELQNRIEQGCQAIKPM